MDHGQRVSLLAWKGFSHDAERGREQGRIFHRGACPRSERKSRANFGLYPKKGAIVPGADADLVVVDLERKVKITRYILHTVTPWTIYDGWEATAGRDDDGTWTYCHEMAEGEPRPASAMLAGEYQRRSLPAVLSRGKMTAQAGAIEFSPRIYLSHFL